MSNSFETFGLKPADPGGIDHDASDDDSLRPYQDVQFFKKRFAEPNRYIRRNPELRDEIKNALLADDDQSLIDTISLIDTARQIDSPAQQPPVTALLAQLALDREIDRIHIDTLGGKAPTNRANAITSLAKQLHIDQLDDEVLQDYRSAATLIRSQFNTPTLQYDPELKISWFTTKLRHIESLLDNRILATLYVEQMPEESLESISPIEAEQDTEKISPLFELARKQQRYGVKMGYKKQAHQSGSLVYIPNLAKDRDLTNSNLNIHPLALAQSHEALCHVIDSPLSRFGKNLRFKEVVKDDTFALTTDFDARGGFDILPGGELRMSGTTILLRDLALRYDKYTTYRRLQAEVLANYLDLTNPMTEHDWIAPTDMYSSRNPQSSPRQQAPCDIVRDMLIARLPGSRNNTAHEDDRNHGNREVRLHGVVWHIRQLPAGWKASPGAEELAAQAGITLREGETFVRPHSRGSKNLGEVAVHRFVSRS